MLSDFRYCSECNRKTVSGDSYGRAYCRECGSFYDDRKMSDREKKIAEIRKSAEEARKTKGSWVDGQDYADDVEFLLNESERLRAALEEVYEELKTLHFMIDHDDDIFHERKKKYLSIIDYTGQSVAGQALSTTTEPTGARREICPDHSDEKPQISSSHTWTQDGNTYFVSYVEYCPTCYHVISTSARL